METLVSQYIAYLDGRIHEVALDWYAQADDGSVWYFGEDVFNYEDGRVANTNATWRAGRDGPVAMIMPATPQVGDVFRPENIPGIVFEEVTVQSINVTVEGPSGPVNGAIVTEELHMDGSYEDKTFAPGYGEFSTGSFGDLEAITLAAPTDALSTPLPPELVILSRGATGIFDAVAADDWDAADTTLAAMITAWETFHAGGEVPAGLDAQMSRALATLAGDALAPALAARDHTGAGKAALRVAHASLDLQLRHRTTTEIDLARFDLWSRQLLVDSAGDDPGKVTGDVAVLEWVWERIAHTLDRATATQINNHLSDLRSTADAEDLAAASVVGTKLQEILNALQN